MSKLILPSILTGSWTPAARRASFRSFSLLLFNHAKASFFSCFAFINSQRSGPADEDLRPDEVGLPAGMMRVRPPTMNRDAEDPVELALKVWETSRDAVCTEHCAQADGDDIRASCRRQ